MTFLDKFSLDREKRLEHKLHELNRLERIAQLDRDIKAAQERLDKGIPAPATMPISQSVQHKVECRRRYYRYGIAHYPTDGCPCHRQT